MASFHARAFGLTLAADVPVPGLLPADAQDPDIRIHLTGFPAWFDVGAAAGPEIWSSSHEADSPADAVSVRSVGAGRFLLVAYEDGVQFLLSRRGDEIWVRGPAGVTVETVATYLLGPVIGLALRLRGTICLHASAVAVGGAAVAFVGDAGAGKSTIAAAFALRGDRVLTDDIAALARTGAVWTVEPGVPSVRLWDDSVELLLERATALPLMAAGWEKRYLDLAARGPGFSTGDPLPLAAVYVLERDGPAPSETAACRLSPRQALIALVRNTYANVLLDREMRAVEFAGLSNLVSTVPVFHVRAPASGDELDAFRAAVVREGSR